MGRRERALGTHGAITAARYGTGWRARVRLRDWTGTPSQLERHAKTRAEAITAVRSALDDRLAGRSAGTGTLGEAVENYLATTEVSASTRPKYRSAWNAVAPELENLRLFEVTPALIHACYQRRLDAGKNFKMLRSVLRGSLDLAVAQGLIQGNPAKSAPSPRKARPETTHRVKVLTPQTLQKLLTACDAYPERGGQEAFLGPLVRTLASTAYRISEGLALVWDDFDAESGTLTANHHMDDLGNRLEGRKWGGLALTVALPDALAAELRERAERMAWDGPIFAGRGGVHRSAANARRSLRAALKAADLKEIGFHDLRRTTITAVALSEGVEAAQRLAGHRSRSTTEAHYIAQTLKAPDVRAITAAIVPPTGGSVWYDEESGCWIDDDPPLEILNALGHGDPDAYPLTDIVSGDSDCDF